MSLMLLLKLNVLLIIQWIIFSNADSITLVSSSNDNDSSIAISHRTSELGDSAEQVTLGTIKNRVPEEVLQDIYKISKNISHSKGHLIKNKGGEMEFRRSVTRKVMESANSLVLEKWLLVLKNNISATLHALNELEFLVHQYETAVTFKNLGGIDLLFRFIENENITIVSGALFVLTAAMQGNPEIQKYVEKFGIIEYLLDALSYESYSSIPGALSVLSSYLRNMPGHQMEFLHKKGLTVFGKILKHSEKRVRYQVRVIDLIGLLAKEIYAFPEYGSKNTNSKLQWMFSKGVIDNGLCEEIPNYLQYKNFIFHEKIVGAMEALTMICYEDFSKEHVIKLIKNLKDYYNPSGNDAKHSSMDKELKLMIYESLEILSKNVFRKKIVKTLKKTEL